MKRLRRKRSSDNTKAALSISLPQPVTPSGEAPLYARFATAHKPQHGTKPIVSGPMALTTKQAFSGTAHPTHERTSESRPRTLSTRQGDAAQRLSSSPPKPSSRRLKESSTITVPPQSSALRVSHSQDEPRSESSPRPRPGNIITSQSATTGGSSDGTTYPQWSTAHEITPRQVLHSSRQPATRDVHVPDDLPTTPQRSQPSVLHHQSAMAVGTGTDDQEYDPFRTSIFVSPVGPTSARHTADVPPIPSRATESKSNGHAAGTHSDHAEDIPPPVPSKALPSIPVASPKASLVTSPSSRKKYSPLAAFGGVNPQANSHSTSTASVVSSRTQTDQAHPDVDSSLGNEIAEISPTARGELPTSPMNLIAEERNSANIGTGRGETRSRDDMTPNVAASEPRSPTSHTQSDSDQIGRSPLQQERVLSRIHTAEGAGRHSSREREQDSTHLLTNSSHTHRAAVTVPTMPERISPVKASFVARILPKGSRSHRRTGSASTAQPSQSQAPEPSSSSQSTAITANRTGPTRGRPLIFAAMSGPEHVDNLSTPVPEADQSLRVDIQQAHYVDETSAQAYPSPTSPVDSVTGSQKPFDNAPPPPPVPEKVEEPEPRRRRKLSKPNKNAPRPIETHVVAPSDVGDQPSPRHHHNHHHDKPTTPVDTQPQPSWLGPPIPIQKSQSEDTGRQYRHKRSGSGEQNKLTRKPRDGGVKPLTEKQLEKLTSRNVSQNSPVTTPPAAPSVPPPMTPEKDRVQLPSPPFPEDYAQARSHRRGQWLEKVRPGHLVEMLPAPEPEVEPPEREPTPEPVEPPEPTYYPLARHMEEPALLTGLLPYLSYYEWCVLSSVSKEIRTVVYERRELECVVLERYLRTVGYSSWVWKQPEPLVLTLKDLHSYLHGVSIPSHQYARMAEEYLLPQSTVPPTKIRDLQASCRSFTRVVLRLRAQAEAEAEHNARVGVPTTPPAVPQNEHQSHSRTPSKWSSRQGPSRSSSRAPSPTSSFSHAHSLSPGQRPVNTFRSPLFRPRRAPLLQVFVPSPEGDWLSDASVIECEAELKRAGVLHLMRAGDIVWDIAVGDEGNLGRMVWDGSYLIDLDYTYSRVGDLPKYLPTLAFPPSYFHRVIRTMGTGNPIVHIDIAPWGDQIESNLQLLQDRMKTETPQGGQHTVVRWVHRSSCIVKPLHGTKSIRIPVPSTAGPGPSPSGAWVVDPGWYGRIVVESEGTNEGLADLQARCKGAFPPRATGAMQAFDKRKEDRKTVFRLLRERSRPGELWLRTVREKERLMPPTSS